MIKLLNHEHFIREVSKCAVVVNRVGTIALTIICIIYEWLEGKGHLAVMSKWHCTVIQIQVSFLK